MLRLPAALVTSLMLFAATAAQSADTVLRTGAAAPLSGPQASFGQGLVNGMRLYVDQLNAGGGLPGGVKVELDASDDKADPREGVLVAQKFCDDTSVLAVLGHFNSGVTIPTLDVYGSCGMPQVTISSNPKVTNLGSTQVFRVIDDDYSQAEMSATYGFDTLRAKTAAVIDDKQVFGQGVAKIFSDKFKKLGGQISSSSGVNATDVDFGPLITKLKSENPDIVYVGAVMPQLALILRQMREQGLHATYMMPDGGYTEDFFAQAQKANADGALVTIDVPPYDSTAELAAFAKAYKTRFGEEPGAYSAHGYLSAWVVGESLKALPAADRKRESLTKELHTITLKKSVLGIDVSFNEKGEIRGGSTFLYKAVDGKFQLVR